MRVEEVRLLGRLVCALSADATLPQKLALLKIYPRHSWKRALAYRFVQMIFMLRLNKLFFESVQLDQSLQNVVSDCMKKTAYLLFTYPPGDRERNRDYYFFLDTKTLALTLFLKHAKEKNCIANLQNEVEALQLLNNKKNELQFKFPEIVSNGFTEEGTFFLITKAFSSTYRRIEQEKVCSLPAELQLPGEGVFSVAQLKRQSWWQSLQKNSHNEAFVKCVNKILSERELVKLSSCHGDIGAHNVYWNGKNYFLIDWERFSQRAPYLTDQVGWWLGRHHKLIKSKPLLSRSLFKKKFINFEDDATLGLAYLVAAGFFPAKILSEVVVN